MSTWAGSITLEGLEVFVRVDREEPGPGQTLGRWHGEIKNRNSEVDQWMATVVLQKPPPVFKTRIGQIYFTDFYKFQGSGPLHLPKEEA